MGSLIIAMMFSQIVLGAEYHKQVLFERPFGDGPNDVGALVGDISGAQLPGQIAVIDGYVYFSDWGRKCIRKYTIDGSLIHSYSGLSVYGEFAILYNGDLYYQLGDIAEKKARCVKKDGGEIDYKNIKVTRSVVKGAFYFPPEEKYEIPNYSFDDDAKYPNVSMGEWQWDYEKHVPALRHETQYVMEYAKKHLGIELPNNIRYVLDKPENGNLRCSGMFYDNNLNCYIFAYSESPTDGLLWQRAYVFNSSGVRISKFNCPLNYSRGDSDPPSFWVDLKGGIYQLVNLGKSMQVIKWVKN
jgi:hypothetical protein